MRISRRLGRRLRHFVALIGVGFAVGVGYRALQGALGAATTDWALVGSGLTGALIAALVGAFELLYLPSRAGERLRRRPFAVLLVARAGVAAVLIVAALVFGNLVIIASADARSYPFSSQVLIDLAVSFGVTLALLFLVQVRQIVGARVLADFMLGRYFRPVRERRVFLFVDLADSTALAERLGDEGVHALITRFFSDIAEPILEHDGETHRYIGDQVVITWPYDEGIREARCVRCAFAIADEIEERRAEYQRRFGLVPGFRAGLHGGSVVAGECGEDKREIVYFGDTVNVAARVEALCKSLGHRMLVTRDVLQDLALPPGIAAAPLGAHSLRGRREATEVFALERAGLQAR